MILNNNQEEAIQLPSIHAKQEDELPSTEESKVEPIVIEEVKEVKKRAKKPTED